MNNNQTTTTRNYSYKDSKGVPYTQVPMNRFPFGICIDALPKNLPGNVASRVADVREQCSRNKFVPMNTEVTKRFEIAQQRGWTSTRQSIEHKLLREAKSIIILTDNLYKVEHQVLVAHYAQTPITIFNPYLTPDLITIGRGQELTEYYNQRKGQMLEYNYSKSLAELDSSFQHYLATVRTPWLEYPSLANLLAKGFYNNVEDFIDYVRNVTNAILSEGQWDVELTATPVQRQGLAVYTTVSNAAETKGLRMTGYNETFKAFYNYDVLMMDELNLFLTLTYYKAVGMKPLQPVAYVPETGELKPVTPEELEIDCTEIYYGDEAFTVTPIYVEPEQHLDPTGSYSVPVRNKIK